MEIYGNYPVLIKDMVKNYLNLHKKLNILLTYHVLGFLLRY